MKIDKHEVLRQTIFVGLLLAIVVSAWYFVFRPRDASDRRLRAEIELKQKQLQRLNRATACIGNLKAEIGDLQEAITFFQSKLPSEKEIDKVLEEVWRLAEANRLTTKGIYTTRRTSASLFLPVGAPQTEQPIKMELVGPFMGLYNFLLALESQPRIMRLRKLELDVLPGNKGKVKAQVEMSIFFESPQGARKS